ncbi:MAG TPA: hypothetical protein VFG69_08935, partial [Nannocystaceae bacterium]|nr:hypothetical protein [Nannocystaceae bacterium]
LARGRSGEGRLVDADGNAMAFTIETTAIGPAVAQGWANCAGDVAVDTPVEVAIRSADGRIDIVVDGTLATEISGGPAVLDVPALGLTDATGVLPMADVGATGEATGLGIDVVGIDGRGSMWWIATGPAPKVPFAELELPYAVSELDFGP